MRFGGIGPGFWKREMSAIARLIAGQDKIVGEAKMLLRCRNNVPARFPKT